MGFITNLLLRFFTNTQQREMNEFITGLKGMNRDEIAALLDVVKEVSEAYRHVYLTSKGIDVTLYDPFVLVVAEPNTVFQIRDIIKDLQKAGDTVRAAGAMVWLHTIRGVENHLLRYTAKEMWAELERGMLLRLPHYRVPTGFGIYG